MSPIDYIWANLRRRPLHNLLAMIAVAIAFTLYGLALGEAVGFSRAAAARHVNIGSGFLLGAMAVSVLGMALILFLIANAQAQSVRLRLSEFGLLKAIGFSHRLILMLVTAEVALPCLAGAMIGLVAAKLLFALLVTLLPPLAIFPAPVYTPALLSVAALLALLIVGVSSALPAARIVRLDAMTALAGALNLARPPIQEWSGVKQDENLTHTNAPVEDGLRALIAADRHLLRQILVVTHIGLSTLRHRIKGAMVIVTGVGAMVFVLLSMLSIAEGIQYLMTKSGDPSVAFIHHANDEWLERGGLAQVVSQIAASSPGVARSKGAPLVDAEVSFGIDLIKRNNGETGFTSILGVGPHWAQVRPSFHLLSGRMPRPGTRELLAGDLARRKFFDLDDGSVLAKALLRAFDFKAKTYVHYIVPQWQIVGLFSTGDLLDGYLIGDATALKSAVNHTMDDVVRVRLLSPADFDLFQRAALKRLPPSLVVERETDYYAGVWRGIENNASAFFVAYALAGLIGAGMVAGTMVTMGSALEERALEIAILRALGFDGIAVASSAVLEAMLLAVVGAIVGAASIWLLMDDFLYAAAGSVYIVRVDFHLLLVGSCWGLVVAIAGSLPIALKAARQTPLEALREA